MEDAIPNNKSAGGPVGKKRAAHSSVASFTSLFRRPSSRLSMACGKESLARVTRAIHDLSGYKRGSNIDNPPASSTSKISFNQDTKLSITYASTMSSDTVIAPLKVVRPVSSFQALNNLLNELESTPISPSSPEKYTNDFNYIDYQRRRGYLPNGMGGQLDWYQFENIKAAIVPFNSERFVSIINEAEPGEEARAVRKFLRSQKSSRTSSGTATTTTYTSTPSGSPSEHTITEKQIDLSYATYISSGGYLSDGSGGKVSERRFAQMKTEVHPFNPARFIALVNSCEHLVYDLGEPRTIMPAKKPHTMQQTVKEPHAVQPTPPSAPDQIMRDLLHRQSNNSRRLANVEAQLFVAHQAQEERYAKAMQDHTEFVTNEIFSTMWKFFDEWKVGVLDAVATDSMEVRERVGTVVADVEALTERLENLEGSKEGVK